MRSQPSSVNAVAPSCVCVGGGDSAGREQPDRAIGRGRPRAQRRVENSPHCPASSMALESERHRDCPPTRTGIGLSRSLEYHLLHAQPDLLDACSRRVRLGRRGRGPRRRRVDHHTPRMASPRCRVCQRCLEPVDNPPACSPTTSPRTSHPALQRVGAPVILRRRAAPAPTPAAARGRVNGLVHGAELLAVAPCPPPPSLRC